MNADFSSILLTTLAKRREETIARCLEAASRTSQRLVFSHSTALLLLGAELPDRIARDAREELHVCVSRQEQRQPLLTVAPHVWSGVADVQIPYNGLMCVGPCVAWAQISPQLTLEELVVLGDALMRRNPKLRLAAASDFDNMLVGPGKFPSKRKCKLAMRLMRESTDSSRETLTRLLIMRYGLPCPQVNYGIPAGSGGMLHFDMAYPNLKIAIEYQGSQHDTDVHQARLDRGRRDFLRTRGWVWLEPDNRIFIDQSQCEEFIENLAMLLSDRLKVVLTPSPLMTLYQTADARRSHNRRNAQLPV
ncbi:hypothetical protein [Bifidobacterium avesanii]|uniref:DUF559 domain-containing protein n=1 Tax=Bifidobacterium avesanii TaxID=1798157 RepID=A0A7K3TF59_9BIFI|nr:hypothetical protein [Bifidobacterium avesanii]KAB8294437.1 hypothetical protein DSM100685_0565 [Bifidobacterium avesanii]NEG77731.1 hypothetical protein [Bifidobacterium avesanii]